MKVKSTVEKLISSALRKFLFLVFDFSSVFVLPLEASIFDVTLKRLYSIRSIRHCFICVIKALSIRWVKPLATERTIRHTNQPEKLCRVKAISHSSPRAFE